MSARTGLLAMLVLFLTPMGTAESAAQTQPSPAKTVPESMNYMWKMVEKDFTSLAEAMPKDKWSFKPTKGAFKEARTFGEQVKHVACANEAWARKLQGEAPPERCDLGGPNPAKTKAEILTYLRQSFEMMDRGIAATDTANLLSPVKGPYAGDNRFEVLTAVLWHISDHYGQLVEYLRMNGIVPPASR